MTLITEDLDVPGADGLHCQVEVTLVGAGGAPVTGYTATGHTITGANVLVPTEPPSGTSSWQLDLVANSAIVPAGTVYRRVVHTPRGVVADDTFDVPASGGPYDLGDRIVDPPAAIAPAALAVAIAASEA
jgi:hypothetical protein